MRTVLKQSLRWTATISLVSAIMAMVLSASSNTLLQGMSWSGGLLVVLLIIAIGVVFDMLGIAATAAREAPFHSMAAKKVPGARHAIGIIRRADQFSNFCNDVVGDISGILSGAAAFAVVSGIIVAFHLNESRWWVEMLMVAAISALTVGGKALGKTVSIRYANEIIYRVGQMFYFLETRFHIRLFNVKNNKKRKRKRGVVHAPRSN
jgi:CBS domain containing-hemolysin-like protein